MLKHLTDDEINTFIGLCDALPNRSEPWESREIAEGIRKTLFDPDPNDVHFRNYLSDLSPQKRLELTALALLGRNKHPSFEVALRSAAAEEIDNDSGFVCLTGMTRHLTNYRREG